MFIYFACPKCSRNYSAKAELAGREFKCTRCGIMLVIPDQSVQKGEVLESDPPASADDLVFDTRSSSPSTEPARGNPPSPAGEMVDIPEALPVSPPVRRSLGEILLDPRTIYLLLISGALLLVVGIVTLLYVNDLLTPLTLAGILGTANVAVLGGGLYLRRYTRYPVAGLAVTLLACAVMPLNLWYYHANDLLTFGDFLWVPALVISGLYFMSALVLRDERFVYVFLGGIALTGLLIIADLPPSPLRFWETAYPATWLVLLGLAALHLERAFPDEDGPFSRQGFGRAFFQSGLISIAIGLFMVLVAYIGGDWGYEALFRPLYELWETHPSPIVNEQRWLAFLLVLAGMYAALYADTLVLKSVRVSLVVPALLVWATVLAYQMLGLELTRETVIVILAALSVPLSLLRIIARQHVTGMRLIRIQAFSLLVIAIVIGVYSWAYAHMTVLDDNPDELQQTGKLSWLLPLGMFITAVAGRVAFEAGRWDRGDSQTEQLAALIESVALLIAATSALTLLGVSLYTHQAVLLFAIPLAYLTASYVYPQANLKAGARLAAHTSAILVLFFSIFSLPSLFPENSSEVQLFWALLFTMAAAFYGLAALIEGRAWYLMGSVIGLLGAAWQVAIFAQLPAAYVWTVISVLGLSLMAYLRFESLRREGAEVESKSNNLEKVSHFILLPPLAGEALMMWFSVLAANVGVHLVIVTGLQSVIALAAGLLTGDASLRRVYLIGVLVLVGLTIFGAVLLFDLEFWQKVELALVLFGSALLAVGHYAWYQETEREDPLATLALLFGSLLFILPLAIATWYDRYNDQFRFLNELGFLAGAVLLLVSGLILRLKATTLVGGTLTVLYFLTLLIFVPWSRMSFLAILMIIGGALLFLVGLALSIFRERLMALPGQIQRREGVFRVLDWR